MSPAAIELRKSISRIVGSGAHPLFSSYWELASQVVNEESIDAFYVRQTQGYVDVAILSNHCILGCEADENTPASGHVSAYRLGDAAHIQIRRGPALGLQRSENANLTFILFGPSNDVVAYWVAETKDEMTRLQTFGSDVIKVLRGD